MRKIIARIAAVLVCIVAAFAIYTVMNKAYFRESIEDFIAQGENFAANRVVNPEEVQDNTVNGQFVRYIAVYWRTFQDLNNEMDAETTKMMQVFKPANLQSDEMVAKNIQALEDYRGLIQDRSDKVEKNVYKFIENVQKLNPEELKVGNVAQVKAEVAKDAEFRKNAAEIRKTIASYMYAALEFLQTRRHTVKFEANGAITFANPADQKYFYDLLEVVKQSDAFLKDMMAANRNDIRKGIVEMKASYDKFK